MSTWKNAVGMGGDAVAVTAEWGTLSAAQIRLVMSYYAEHRQEIDERIARNARAADEGLRG